MNKKELRPLIASAVVAENMSTQEQFQNKVLRPVIKLQHNIIVALFESYLKHSNFDINTLDNKQKKRIFKEYNF